MTSINRFFAVFCLSMLPFAAGGVLNDPTRPNGDAAVESVAGGWQLNATRITPQRRIAVINGVDVAEGGMIGAARVIRISHAQVEIDNQGEILRLQLSPATIKTNTGTRQTGSRAVERGNE